MKKQPHTVPDNPSPPQATPSRWRSARVVAIAIVILIFALIFMVPRAPAPPPSPERPETVIVDNAGLLSPEFIEETARWLHAIQLFEGVIYIDGAPPEGDLQPWTVQTATEWGVGTDKQDRGLVLFIFRDTRTVRAEIGYGLEGMLPDVTMKRLLETLVAPAFAQGQYEAGLETLIKTLYEGLGGDAEAGRLALEAAAKPHDSWSELWNSAWQNGARLLPAVWRFYRQGTALDRFGVFAFALPLVFFTTTSLVALVISLKMLIRLPGMWRMKESPRTDDSRMASGKQPNPRELPLALHNANPGWRAFMLLTPIAMGIFLALLSGAIATLVFAMAPDSLTRQGKFGGGGVAIIWPSPSLQ